MALDGTGCIPLIDRFQKTDGPHIFESQRGLWQTPKTLKQFETIENQRKSLKAIETSLNDIDSNEGSMTETMKASWKQLCDAETVIRHNP